MTKADLELAIQDVHRRSIAAYLERQQLEQARITLAQQIARCEQTFLTTDGELTALTALLPKVEA